MYNFNLSGFYDRFHLLKKFISSEHLKDTIKIFCSFDSFPGVIWNGGRPVWGDDTKVDRIKEIIDYYNSRNIGIRYTFTNLLLEEKHLSHELGNICLELAHNEMNSVVVATDLMKNYVRKNYPKYKLVWSLTANNKDFDYLKGKLSDLDYVAFPPDLNRNLNFFEQFSAKERSRIEILVNENCELDCCDRTEHYIELSKWQLDKERTPWSRQNKLNNCPGIINTIKNPHIGDRPLHILYNDLKKYNDMGIEHFKIQARSTIPDNSYIEILSHYLIKDEYQKLYGDSNVK